MVHFLGDLTVHIEKTVLVVLLRCHFQPMFYVSWAYQLHHVISVTNFHRVELFDGAGGLVEGVIHKVDKSGSDVELLEDARIIAPQGIQWHVFAAFGESCEMYYVNHDSFFIPSCNHFIILILRDTERRTCWLAYREMYCMLQLGCSSSSLSTSKSVFFSYLGTRSF